MTRSHVEAITDAASSGEERGHFLFLRYFSPPPFSKRGALSELSVVQVLHSDDYNATRVQYITLISHTGAQWYHN